jgi:hypothetical protein
MLSTLSRPLTTRLNTWMVANPLKTSMCVTTAKAGGADLFVQTHIEGRETIDVRRSATFFLFGFTYQGCFQYWMFTRWFERLFPGTGLRAAGQKVSVCVCARARCVGA